VNLCVVLVYLRGLHVLLNEELNPSMNQAVTFSQTIAKVDGKAPKYLFNIHKNRQ
jgi:hypothetical protein